MKSSLFILTLLFVTSGCLKDPNLLEEDTDKSPSVIMENRQGQFLEWDELDLLRIKKFLQEDRTILMHD